MRYCDITIAYNDKSGGIRTYIDEKRRFIERNTNHEHVLIVPGEEQVRRREGRLTIVQIPGPLLPNQNDYRVFLSGKKIKAALRQTEPDIVELGSYYLEPWAAFSYRRRRRARGQATIVSGYFHTDVAEAYVAAPLKSAVHGLIDDVSETLGHVAEKVVDVAASGAEHYIRSVFRNCDLAFAAAPAQAARLQEQGVESVEIVPMGVDLDLFSPERRDGAVREGLGADPDHLVLVYAGRLSTEKQVLLLVEALDALPADLCAHLWLIGEGPLHEDLEAVAADKPRLRLLPYEKDRPRFAALLASADIYVTAGPFETFGLSVIEAQACGLPVVGVDAGALRDRVPPSLGALGPVSDSRAMARNIAQVACRRREIGARAREHVSRCFSWDRTFESLFARYDRCLADAATAGSVGGEPVLSV